MYPLSDHVHIFCTTNVGAISPIGHIRDIGIGKNKQHVHVCRYVHAVT
jgi:hypothetical protein